MTDKTYQTIINNKLLVMAYLPNIDDEGIDMIKEIVLFNSIANGTNQGEEFDKLINKLKGKMRKCQSFISWSTSEAKNNVCTIAR